VKSVGFLVLYAGFFSFLPGPPQRTFRAKAQGRGLPHLPLRPTLTTEGANGATVSLYVDQSKFKHSIHGRMFACVDCHTDVKSLVHEKPPEKVTCAQCHADAQTAYAHSTQASKGGKRPPRPVAKTATATRTRSKAAAIPSRP
jgi:hypothetical protein